MEDLLIIGGTFDQRQQEVQTENKLLQDFLGNFERIKGEHAKSSDNPYFWFEIPDHYYPFKTKPVIQHRISDNSVMGLAELILQEEAKQVGMSSRILSLNEILNNRWQLKDPGLFSRYKMVAFATTYITPPLMLYLLKSLPIPSHIKLFVGGPGAFKMKDSNLPQIKFSYFLRSEAEGRFRELLRHAKGEAVDLTKIPGLTWREGNEIKHSSQTYQYVDLNCQPPVDVNQMALVRGGRVLYESSRGCPFRCSFCDYPFLMNNHEYRFKSAEKIHQDWQIMAQSMAVNDILCLDSTFTRPRKRMKDLCRLLSNSGLNNSLHWGCYARADDLADIEMAKMMYEAGCRYIYIGFESGSQQILDYMNKGCTVEDNYKAIMNCNQARIMTIGLFIAGFPGETPEMFQETRRFLQQSSPFLLSVVPWMPDFTDNTKVPIMQPQCRKDFGIHIESPSAKKITLWNNCDFRANNQMNWGFYWSHKGMDLQMAWDCIGEVVQDIYQQKIKAFCEELFFPTLIDDPLNLYHKLGTERALDFYLGLTTLVLSKEKAQFHDWCQEIKLNGTLGC